MRKITEADRQKAQQSALAFYDLMTERYAEGGEQLYQFLMASETLDAEAKNAITMHFRFFCNAVADSNKEHRSRLCKSIQS